MSNKLKVLEVADRCGWAIDRLSKPMAIRYDDIDMSYFSVSPDRYLDSGYSDWKKSTGFTQELAEEYDVLHFHRVKACLFDFSKMKAKKVITVHTERHEDWEDPRLKDFDLVIAPTKHAMEHFLKTFPEMEGKVKHIPHGIDLDRYHKMNIAPDEKVVGYVGRVVEWKRWSELQKAVHLARLKLAGCGYIENGKKYNIHSLSEDKDFSFQTFLQESQMSTFYNKMNLFVCLSVPHVEAGPLPLMEAMACGVPVISTRVGWAADYCEHGKNVVFVSEEEANDPKRLAGIINNTFNDIELRKRLSQNGLELIKQFGLDTYCDNLMKAYEELIN